MITTPEELMPPFLNEIRSMQKSQCENIVRSHYSFVEDLDPYEAAPHLPETIGLLTENCLDNARLMFDRLRQDATALEGCLGIKANDTLRRADPLDSYCSIFALEFASGARIVYKDIPSAPYALWEFAATEAGISPMSNLCRGDYLYSEFKARQPLSATQSPQSYYENLGRLFALAHLFGAGDMHAANLYPIGDAPVIIDCDMLLHIGLPYWRIAASGCLPYDDGGEYRKPATSTPFYDGSACPFDANGRVFPFENYPGEIKRGYTHCATQVLPEIRGEFLAMAQGARYRYLPMKEALIGKLFRQRIVFGHHEPASDAPIVRKIMESVNQLKQPKFYVEIDADTLYYGNAPIGNATSVSTALLKHRFEVIPTQADIAIQFEDIDNAAKMLETARKTHEAGLKSAYGPESSRKSPQTQG